MVTAANKVMVSLSVPRDRVAVLWALHLAMPSQRWGGGGDDHYLIIGGYELQSTWINMNEIKSTGVRYVPSLKQTTHYIIPNERKTPQHLLRGTCTFPLPITAIKDVVFLLQQDPSE